MCVHVRADVRAAGTSQVPWVRWETGHKSQGASCLPCWVGRTDDPTAATGRRAHERARPDGGFQAGAMNCAPSLTTGLAEGTLAPSALTVPFRFDQKPWVGISEIRKARRKSASPADGTQKPRGPQLKYPARSYGQGDLQPNCTPHRELAVTSPNGGVPDRWHGIRAAGSAFWPRRRRKAARMAPVGRCRQK